MKVKNKTMKAQTSERFCNAFICKKCGKIVERGISNIAQHHIDCGGQLKEVYYSKVFLLEISPKTHVRSTHEESMCFKIFGHLYRIPQRTPREQKELDRRKDTYKTLYKRFLQLERYNEYKRQLREEAVRKSFYMPDEGMQVNFYIPVPPSWRPGKKRKHHLMPHRSKPDTDNLLKAFIDGLKPQQDCAIWHLAGARKYWINDTKGLIRVEILPQPIEQGADPRNFT